MAERSHWLELTITCSPALTDAATDYLVGVLEAGVEFGVEDHLLEHTLHAFLPHSNPSSEQIAAITAQVQSYLDELADIFQAPAPKVVGSLLEDEDWSSGWKKHFRPFAVTPGLIIKPSWEAYAPLAGEVVIEMDPGMAFGTGHHATTSLCLDLMRAPLAELPGPVLDVGTGTGILAMAAALFGSPQVLALDNDPAAVEAALENVAHNGLQQRVTVAVTPLNEVRGEFRLVVANIIHDVLLAMVPELSRLTGKGGTLVLSGILEGEQADRIGQRYIEAGFVLEEKACRGEWAALQLTRRGGA